MVAQQAHSQPSEIWMLPAHNKGPSLPVAGAIKLGKTAAKQPHNYALAVMKYWSVTKTSICKLVH
jgi:hypothetical protein